MDTLEQPLKNFEDKSQIFGGKKRLIDILEYLTKTNLKRHLESF